jgi:hypothetical protein
MMMYLKNRGICKEAKKILANDVAAGIETMMVGEWTVCRYRSQESVIGRNESSTINIDIEMEMDILRGTSVAETKVLKIVVQVIFQALYTKQDS